MNKTIEFIEKEIEKLELDDVLCLSTDEDYKFWYDRLKMFQQIKTELEAWEVVKPYIDEGVSFTLSKFLKNNIDKFETLKKALEVKNGNSKSTTH